MSKPVNDIWKDPMVKAALKEGRSADDIAVVECPKCYKYGYYNEGSHFSCRFCDRTWYVCGDEEPAPDDGRPYMRLYDQISLADTL